MWLVGSKPIKSNVVQQHLFRAFCVIANSGRSESTVSFAKMTSCAICYDVIYHPFAINSQYLKTWEGWQPCRSNRRGSKHKELAALIAERSVPIIQFMSSKAVSSSSSDKPGPLMSCGLHSSPSVRDAGAETPSSFASLKETVEKQSKTSQLVAKPKSHQSSSKRKLEEASKIDSEIDQKMQKRSKNAT